MKNKIKLTSSITVHGKTNQTVEHAKGNVEGNTIIFYSQIGNDSFLNKITLQDNKATIQRGHNIINMELNKNIANDYISEYGKFEINTLLTDIVKSENQLELVYLLHAMDIKQYFNITIEWGENNE